MNGDAMGGIVAAALLAIVVAILVVAAWAIREDSIEKDRLITQCMADGKKEYECKAMFGGKSSSAVIPMPVYLFR